MRFQDIQRSPSTKMLRQFGWLAAIIFLTLSAYHYGIHQRSLLGMTLAVAGILFGILGSLQPKWLGPIYITWMFAAFPIGWVVSHVILAFIFYGCFLPLGWILRIKGYDPLKLKRPAGSTFWQDRPPGRDIRRYLKQY